MTKKVAELRAKYPVFTYQGVSYDLVTEGLKITFDYRVDPDLHFQPTTLIEGVTAEQLSQLPTDELNAYLFHLGMVELYSCWKATCSPRIEVSAGFLDARQIEWWHTLLMKGMGEYFFVNDIDFTEENFVTIVSTALASPTQPQNPKADWAIKPFDSQTDRLLIPVGGGKDSALTIELLKEYLPEIKPAFFMLDPTGASEEIVSLYPDSKAWKVTRHRDPKLDELNRAGYPNGHTPFSAMAGSYAVFVARLFGYTHVAVSNERSSNEGSVMFHNHEINHQYTKTYEFEKNFQTYLAAHFAHAPFYFSILRPLFELQIARAFSKYIGEGKPLATMFKSCNRGWKTNSWCGECPKCLFTYSVLFPFLPREQMLNIFGSDLFEKPELLPTALELLGQAEKKPLECVGTMEENNVAFYLSVQKYRNGNQPLPALLQLVEDQVLSKESNLAARAEIVLSSWNPEHSLPPLFEQLILRVCETS